MGSNFKKSESAALKLPAFSCLTRLMLLLGCCTILAACASKGSFPSTKKAEADPSNQTAPIPASIQAIEPTYANSIEIVWAVPKDPVDGFIIYIGTAEDTLAPVKKVPVEELQLYTEPEFGPIYRIILDDANYQTDVFAAIAAYSGDEESALSNTIKIPAN